MDQITTILTQKPTQTNERTLIPEDVIAQAKVNIEVTPGAARGLEDINNPNAFYEMNPLVKVGLPANMLNELFYVLKSGMYSEDVHAYFLFAAQEAYKRGALNNYAALFEEGRLEKILNSKNINTSFTLEEVIRTLYPDFKVVTETAPKVPSVHKGFYEVYLAGENYCALIPEELAAELSNEDLRNIKEVDGKLMLSGQSLLEIAGYVGVSVEVYDYREAY